jgi:hypothetical protein
MDFDERLAARVEDALIREPGIIKKRTMDFANSLPPKP